MGGSEDLNLVEIKVHRHLDRHNLKKAELTNVLPANARDKGLHRAVFRTNEALEYFVIHS